MEVSQKITDEAAALFLRYGIKSVTMDDICRSLAISKKTIYQSFKDKNEIVCTVARNFLENESVRLSDINNSSSNAIDKLYYFSVIMREIFEKINTNVLFDLKKYYRDAWDIYMSYKRDVFFEGLISTINQGIEEGYFRKNLNPEVIATLRLEEIQWIFDEQMFPVDKYDFKEVQMQIFDHFIYGIVTYKGYEVLEQYANKK